MDQNAITQQLACYTKKFDLPETKAGGGGMKQSIRRRRTMEAELKVQPSASRQKEWKRQCVRGGVNEGIKG